MRKLEVLSVNEQLEKLTKCFISESISDQDPAGLCFPTSFLLQIYLGTKQIKSSLIKGEVPVKKTDGTYLNNPHYWLQIDSTDIIVDATIKQFNNPDPIYVGKIQDNEITKTYIPNELELQAWFPTDFGIWKHYFEESVYPPPLDECPYHKRSTIYTLKLATILHEECKKLNSVDEFTKYHYVLYLTPIYYYLYHWQKGLVKLEMKKEIMPSAFGSFLEEVLAWGDEEINNKIMQS
jgi:hypothetical protein